MLKKQSGLSPPVSSQKQPDTKIVNIIQQNTMSRNPETRRFKDGFMPAELKNTDSRGRTTETTTQSHGSSDRKENLPDPRWHKRPPAKGKKRNSSTAIQNSQTWAFPEYKQREK